MQTSRSGYKLDKEEMIRMANNWLNARTEDGFFDVPLMRAWLGFAYFNCQVILGPPKYTHCILTCVSADGKDWTPAMLFTYNPVLMSPAAKIFVFQVCGIVIDQPRGGKKVYATESADMVSAFFKPHTVGNSL